MSTKAVSVANEAYPGSETSVTDGTTLSLSTNPAAPPSGGLLGEHDGREYAGVHLLVDFWNADHLDDLEVMERALRDAVTHSGATLLHIHLHHFTPNAGISGVAVLAESHISVHTWPERGFAAFDIFMCGQAQPEAAVEVLEQTFAPKRTEVRRHLRGAISRDA